MTHISIGFRPNKKVTLNQQSGAHNMLSRGSDPVKEDCENLLGSSLGNIISTLPLLLSLKRKSVAFFFLRRRKQSVHILTF